LIERIPAVKERKRRKAAIKAVKYASLAALFLFFLSIVFLFVEFSALKAVYEEARAGRKEIYASLDYLKLEKFNEAKLSAGRAETHFGAASSRLGGVKRDSLVFLNPLFRVQIVNADYLLGTASGLSRAIGKGADFAQEFKGLVAGEKKLSLSQFTPEEKKKILGRIHDAGPELSGMKADLDFALANLERVRLPWPLVFFKKNVRELEAQVREGSEFLARAIPMSRLLPGLAGYPEKAVYLVMLENSDELRPTGGFLGTYGILEIENSDIRRFETHDIYHMDMPVKDKISIEPPAPLKKYLNPKWYMRDANWSPDWPTAARQIEWFYHQENSLLKGGNQINNFSGQFDGIIALTPSFVTSLLELVGPIAIGGVTYDQNNFHDILQYQVEAGYEKLGVPSWQRKEVIGEISKEMKIRLLDMPAAQWKDILARVDKSVLEKNLFIYSSHPELEKIISDLGFGGEVKPVGSDYLMVVDANLGSFKTDNVISRGLEYKVEKRGEDLVAQLRINYAHGGGYDWRTTKYRTYTRVFAPLGSRLVKSEGVTEGDVYVRDELGKTFFGAFKTVEPGEIASLYFEYVLPKNIIKNKEYRLLLQKQGGTTVKDLAVDLNLGNVIKSYSPAGFFAEKIGANRVKWIGEMNMDREFRVTVK